MFASLAGCVFIYVTKIRPFSRAAKFRLSNWRKIQHQFSQFSARAVGVCEITPLSKRLVEFVESVEFVETQTADFEQVIPFSTNSTNSTNGKKTGAFRYIIILVITLPNLIYNILRPHLSQIYLWNLWNLWKRSFLLMSQNVPRPIHRGFRH